MLHQLLEILKPLNALINRLVKEFTQDFSLRNLFLLIIVSFVYGVIHSLGPGHGKLLVTAFFSKNERKKKDIGVLSSLISIIHSSSAIVLSLLLSFVLVGVKGIMKIKIQGYFIVASGILIVIIGLIFLYFKIREQETPIKIAFEKKSPLLIAISAGIIPCPAALMLMLLTISKNIWYVGLISVIFMSLGMFVVLYSFSYFSYFSREKVVNNSRIFKYAEPILEYSTIFIIIIIGIVMISDILA